MRVDQRRVAHAQVDQRDEDVVAHGRCLGGRQTLHEQRQAALGKRLTHEAQLAERSPSCRGTN